MYNICTYRPMYTYVYDYACMYMYVGIHLHTCMCMYVCMYVCMHVCMYRPICMACMVWYNIIIVVWYGKVLFKFPYSFSFNSSSLSYICIRPRICGCLPKGRFEVSDIESAIGCMGAETIKIKLFSKPTNLLIHRSETSKKSIKTSSENVCRVSEGNYPTAFLCLHLPLLFCSALTKEIEALP